MPNKGFKFELTPQRLVANRKNRLRAAKPDSLLRQLMGHYRQNASRRGIKFTLTLEDFRTLVMGDCYYCGTKPSRRYRPTRYAISLLSNGVDRVENKEGYEIGNCVSCCKTCNQFKSTLTQQEMFDVVQRIYERHLKCELSS